MRYDKQQHGWRGVVLSRWFLPLVVLVIAALFENPWLAAWIFAVTIAGVLVALVIRAIDAE